MQNPESAWQKVSDRLKETLGEDTHGRWIAVLAPVSTPEEDSLLLAARDEWTKFWIEQNWLAFIRAAAGAVLPGVSVSIAVDPEAAAPAAADAPRTDAESDSDEPSPPRPSPSASQSRPKPQSGSGELRGMPLNPEFTFENFVTGPSNSFAQAAALQVAVNPGGAYNPLMFIGDTGLGKTHLMQAVAHRLRELRPSATIVYITLEAMLNDLIEAIKNGSQAAFRKRYRHTDLLLVDDIQFLSRSPQLQEEFFNTFNALQNERRQIVLTCDRPPEQIQGLDRRLVSRFQQGLVTDIQSPEYATRMAILKSKQAGSPSPVPDEFLAYIADNITSNVRQLEGALTKLVCYRDLIGRPLTREVVEEQLRGFIHREHKAEPSCQDVQRAVADEFELKISDMTSRERPQNVALPRQIAMFLCRRYTHRSLPEIARAFDKTHATVVHACKTVAGRVETDPSIRDRVETVVRKMGLDPAQLL